MKRRRYARSSILLTTLPIAFNVPRLGRESRAQRDFDNAAPLYRLGVRITDDVFAGRGEDVSTEGWMVKLRLNLSMVLVAKVSAFTPCLDLIILAQEEVFVTSVECWTIVMLLQQRLQRIYCMVVLEVYCWRGALENIESVHLDHLMQRPVSREPHCLVTQVGLVADVVLEGKPPCIPEFP